MADTAAPATASLDNVERIDPVTASVIQGARQFLICPQP